MEIPETQQKILNSAKTLVFGKRFQIGSTAQDCDDVGFTLGAFYGYYKNKEELFYALTDEDGAGPCHHCTLHRGEYAETPTRTDALFHAGLLSASPSGVGRLFFALTGKKWCYYFAVLRERSYEKLL